MGMPHNLFLVRHGESEGNLLARLQDEGDVSGFERGFRMLHNSKLRLTPRGVEQAKVTGAWIRHHFGRGFDRYYVSEYVRARETAGHLDLPGARWYSDHFLRERDMGELDHLPKKERHTRYARSHEVKELSEYFWRPPGGESIADVADRMYTLFGTLHRECPEKNVIVVCHGEVIWAARTRLERWSATKFNRRRHDPAHHIGNCQVIWYSRLHPETGAESRHLDWVRSVNPSTHEDGPWRSVEREVFTNDDLLTKAHRNPRLLTEA